MNAPTAATDTAEAWRVWAVLTYRDHDTPPVIARRREAAQRDERYATLQKRWTARDRV